MRTRVLWLCLLLLSAALIRAGELTTTCFAETPEPAAAELLQPRAVAVDATSSRCYVLDSGLRRVVAFDTTGKSIAVTEVDEPALPAPDALPADPLLPIPALAVAGNTVELLTLDRATRTLTLTPLDGAARTLTLPDFATNGAVAVDAAGHVVVAALRVTAGGLELLLAREDAGVFTTLATVKDPCEGQTKNLALTGFVLARGGRLAIGIAQSGPAAYSFIRSWLVQGVLRAGAVAEELTATHRVVLLDSRGKPLDRFRPAIELAGHGGYPAKPCVPLFTALALGPNGTIISGGHSLDPFLRVYHRDGELLAAFTRQAMGGQTLATGVRDGITCLYATDPVQGRVDLLSLDGRQLGSLGTPLPFSLAMPVAMAAAAGSVYVIVHQEPGMRLLRFTAAGELVWAQPLPAPRGLEKARPYLATLGNDRVFIGWRQPDADGVGLVETVMEDGIRGTPLWSEAWTGTSNSVALLNPTPLVAGRNGRLYVQRESKDGTRVQAYSPAGTLLQSFPAEVQGISAVLRDNMLAWMHAGDTGLTLTLYSAQGAQTGWKRVRSEPGDLTLVQTRTPWGWQGTAGLLLRMDDTLTIVEDLTLLGPTGVRVTSLAAVAGDADGPLYFAVPNRILTANSQP